MIHEICDSSFPYAEPQRAQAHEECTSPVNACPIMLGMRATQPSFPSNSTCGARLGVESGIVEEDYMIQMTSCVVVMTNVANRRLPETGATTRSSWRGGADIMPVEPQDPLPRGERRTTVPPHPHR